MTLQKAKSLLPDQFTDWLEQNFYQKIADQARIEAAIADKQFAKNPVKHPALFTDHSMVHVRDVMDQYMHIANAVNGILIKEKSPEQLDFISSYGAALVCLHDIGMSDFSTKGRVMHPEFAAQYVFTSEFEPLLQGLVDHKTPFVQYLKHLCGKSDNDPEFKLLIKELLSLSFAHSKSKVPIERLNAPAALMQNAQKALLNTLDYQYLHYEIRKLESEIASGKHLIKKRKLADKKEKLKALISGLQDLNIDDEVDFSRRLLGDYKGNFLNNSFTWLQRQEPKWKMFTEDVIDSLRLLRAADALRQRGTVLRTSAGYEIFIEQNSAAAIYAIRNSDASKLFLMKANDALNAGEANIASSELDKDGNLRIAFHRGNFKSPSTIRKAAYNVAFVINDIYLDAVLSFKDESDQENRFVNFDDICVLLERTDDNPLFHELVVKNLWSLNEEIARKCKPVVSLRHADVKEISRYLAGENALLHFGSSDQLEEIKNLIEKSGHLMSTKNLYRAFEEVRVVEVEIEEVLIESNTRSGFVYIPMQQGLVVSPMGGYQKVFTKPWVPIGNTGVIRGATRNARIIAQEPLELLMIPSQIYLNYWHKPYGKRSLMKILKSKLTEGD